MTSDELAQRVEAAIGCMCPPQRTETPDYAEITGPGFMMMSHTPDAIMGLLEALPEIAAALRAHSQGGNNA